MHSYASCTYIFSYNRWGYAVGGGGADDDRNNILQRALTLHVAALEPSLDFVDARVVLTQVRSKNGNNSDSDDDDDGDGASGSVASQLKKFFVSNIPVRLLHCSSVSSGCRVALSPPPYQVTVLWSVSVGFGRFRSVSVGFLSPGVSIRSLRTSG
eukprot:SAG31_NODE_370_length_16651_cov_3.511056_7_plen_155_part_00